MIEVDLPRDYEGREIPLETDVLFDANGRKVRVTSYRCRIDVLGHGAVWKVFSPDVRGEDGLLYASDLYLMPPDSWEKLLEDLDESASRSNYVQCGYFGMDSNTCSKCRSRGVFPCTSSMANDIAARIRKLRGGE